MDAVEPLPEAEVHALKYEPDDCEDEPECEVEFDFNYESKDSLSDASIRDMVFQEIKQYHNPVGKFKKIKR